MLIEIKPLGPRLLFENTILSDPVQMKNQCKWKAAIGFVKTREWEFRIITNCTRKTINMNNQSKFNELLFESEKSFSKLTKKSYKFNKTKVRIKIKFRRIRYSN